MIQDTIKNSDRYIRKKNYENTGSSTERILDEINVLNGTLYLLGLNEAGHISF